jgi:hypothetical protein
MSTESIRTRVQSQDSVTCWLQGTVSITLLKSASVHGYLELSTFTTNGTNWSSLGQIRGKMKEDGTVHGGLINYRR